MRNANAVEVLGVKCPGCKREFDAPLYLPTKDGSNPIDSILVYQRSTEDMKAFLQKKLYEYNPRSRLELVPVFTECKGHTPKASIRLAFDKTVLETERSTNFYKKIGESSLTPSVIKDVRVGFITRYQYHLDALNKTLNSYKALEEMEDKLGIKEDFIREIREFSIPKLIKDTRGGNNWLIFSARPELILADMLAEEGTDKVDGKVIIQNTRQVDKSNVLFTVYVHKNLSANVEDPYIRQLIMGTINTKN